MRFTSNDVAKLAGVSQSTVSRAMKGDTNMLPETREKVLSAAQKLGYVPNSFARGLTTQKSNIVAIVIGDLRNSFYTQSLELFSQELTKRGKHLLLFTVKKGMETDDAVRQILEYQIDGIILTAANASMKTAQICLNRDIPVVTYNRYVPGVQVSSICCDNVEGGYVVGQTLIRAGARSFAVIYGNKIASTNKDRLTGFHTALEEAGIAPEQVRLLCGHHTYEGGHAATLEAFADGERHDAILCLNDVMALGALDAVKHRLGLRVPEDVMVAGFDDIVEASRAPYDLTTMRQPITDMVRETLELLGLDGNGSGNGESMPGALTRTIPGILIERGSTRRAPAEPQMPD